jgi:signal transduction histidine kinase
MSFRYRLALFLVVTLVAVQALTAAFAYVYLRHNLVERGKRELLAEMGVFTRQLEFLSERVSDAVTVASLDYALRAAVAQHNHGTELSVLRNHGRRIGATRMMLVALNGWLELDTEAPNKSGGAFPFPALLATAAAKDNATALAAIGDRIYWIVAVPVRAPVPIAFIAACIPVDDALLEKLRAISAQPRAILLAARGIDGHWRIGAQSRVHLPLAEAAVAANAGAYSSSETVEGGLHYLRVAAQLETAKGSRPVVAVLSYPLDEALAAYRSVLIPLLLLLGFALVVAVAGAMIIVRGVSRPLEMLAGAARRIASGDYTAPPKLRQRDEVGHLADALINMTHSIAEREAALKHAVDATEIARSDAVRANEAKSQFLANMSHELRTPLNAIVGFSEMLQQQVLGPIGVSRYLDYAQDIHVSGEQLLGLVERMLDLSEAEANRLALVKTRLWPADVLRQSVASLQFLAQRAGVTLTFVNASCCSPQMEGDAAKLGQAFTNLIHNGIKFTPAGGEVCVSGHSKDDRLSIRIADSGIGMEPDLLATVVRPFHRLRSALDGQHQGAGLGLPFAKAIIELHGGSLELASEVGAGTTVSIELPIHANAISKAA